MAKLKGGYDVGTAFLQVLPSFDDTQVKINEFVSKMRPISIPAKIDPKNFGNEVERAAKQAAKQTQFDLGKPKLDLSNVGKDISKLGKGQKLEIPAELDTALFDAKAKELSSKRLAVLAQVDLDMDAVRARLAELSTQTPKIGVDVDLQVSKLDAQLAALSAKRIRIQAQIDVDAAKAAADIAAVDAGLSHLDGKTAQVNVESSSASRAIALMSLLTAGIAAAGYAAPAAAAAIAAIPAAIGVAGQGVGAILLAFNGIGDAVKAFQAADDEAANKATSNAKSRISSANSLASAQSSLESAQTSADHAAVSGAEQVQSARESLARSEQALGQARESSLRRVQDAERTLASAQRSSREAQEALNQAREDARERIEDLKLSLKGTALDEESAALALEKAQLKLEALKNAGVDSGLEYRESDLAARQAAQSLDEVRERYGDLQKQAQYAAKTGVEGDKAVIAAHRQADDATARIAESERALNQARTDGAREVARAQADVAASGRALSQAQEHAAWANEAATKAVADAQRQLAAASTRAGVDGTTAMDKLQLAMSKLSPAGRSFVSFLQKEAKPALSSMGEAVQKALLPKLEVAFRDLLELSPGLTAALAGAGNVIGDLALKGARMVTSGPWRKDFGRIAATNNDLMWSLGDAGLSIADAFRSILVEVGPILVKFADLAAKGADTFDQFIQGKRATGELGQYMQHAGENLKIVLGFLIDVGKAVYDLATTLAPLGGGLLHIVDFLAKLISEFTTAYPLITNIIGGIGLFAAALLLLGRAVNGVTGAWSSGRDGLARLASGFKGAQGHLQRFADGTGRLAKVSDAALHPIDKLKGAASGLADAYREGSRASKAWAEGQLAAQPAKAQPGPGGALMGQLRSVDDARSKMRDIVTSAQEMGSRIGAAASSAADSLLAKIGPASIVVAEKFDNVTSAAVRTGNALGVKLANGFNALRNPAELMDRTMSRVRDGLESVGSKLKSALEPPIRETAAVLEQGQSKAARFGETLKGHLSNAASTTGDAFRGLGDRVKSGFSTALSGAGDALKGGLSKAGTALESGLKTMSGIAGGTASAIGKGLTGAVSGLTGALGGPWSIALTGATLLLGYFADKQQEASKKAEDYKKDVDSLSQAYKESGGALDQNIVSTNNKALADKNAAANASAAGSSFEIYAQAANGNSTALDKVAEASEGALRSIASQAQLTGEQSDALANVGKTALETGKNYDDLKGNVVEATSTFDEYGTAITGLSDAQTDQVNAILNGVGAVGEQIRKNKEARDAYYLLAAAQSKVSEETIKQWEASTKLRDVTKELAEASLSLRDAQDQLHDSQKDISKAQADYDQAVKEHGKNSQEAKDASDALNDSRRSEEHSLLALLDAAQREAEARNHNLPEQERENKATLARNKTLLELVNTYKGELPQALKDSVAGMTTADALAAGFATTINDLGESIVHLPDGTEIKIDADTGRAKTKLQALLTLADGSKATATLFLDTDPATGETKVWQQNADGTIGTANLQARIDPATGQTQVWVQQANGTWAQSNLDAWIDPASGKLTTWKDAADHTKGLAILDADTRPAEGKLNDFQKWLKIWAGHIGLDIPGLTAPAPKRDPGAPPLPLGGGAMGTITEFFARGGLAGAAKMSSNIAKIVPANSLRVIGDRSVGDEAFIPINKSARSIELLTETARRMGFALAPMALGAVLGFASGAVTASAAPAGSAGAAPSPAAAPAASPDQLDALTAAASALTEALAIVQAATIAYTTTALMPLVVEINAAAIPALSQLLATLTPVQAGFNTTSSVVTTTTANMTTATGSAVAQIGTFLGNLRTGLQITGQAFQSTSDWVRTAWGNIREYAAAPTRAVLSGPFSAGLIAAWNYLDSSFGLNHHLNPIPINFATGGPVEGPGTGTSDSILARLSNGEYVLDAELTQRIYPFLEALRSRKAEALQAAGYAGGGIVADTGSALNAAVARAQVFAAAQRGKPYIWGGVGPTGYDCSGFASAITNVLLGKANPYQRLGVAASEPWPGFVRGLSSAWALGGSQVHTAGTLGGINAESTGNHVRFGGDAHGADDFQFNVQSSLPVVGGSFVSGGSGTFDPAALVASAFTDTSAMIQNIRNQYRGNVMANHGAGEAAYASDRLQKIAVDKISINAVPGGPAVQAAQAFARSALPRFGWGPEQMAPLIALWNGESGWDYRIANKSSGAYGIPQALPPEKMASQGPDWRTNAATQILWGLGYIRDRPDYGSPAAAYAKWMSRSPHWYDTGGWLPPGYSTVANHTGKPEAILTSDQWNAISAMAGVGKGGSGNNVTVYARTDASPEHIAHAVDRRLAIGSRL